MAQKHTVVYFGIPGRGEAVRLMLVIGGHDFEDRFIAFNDWVDTKSRTRWGMVPNLTLPCGTVIGQSRAILRYLGKSTFVNGQPLYPNEPEKALLVDEVCDVIEDIWAMLLETRSRTQKLSKDEKAAEYRSLVGLDGAVGKVLSQLEDVCRHPYVAGCSVTIADVHLFAAIGWWASGFFSKAVTLESLLMNSPKLRATAQLVGAIPQVNKYYQLPKHSTPLHANYKTLSTAKL